jgi:CheY-like chemotaxis protein/nitrogen-specific signal transduction histidine kinase
MTRVRAKQSAAKRARSRRAAPRARRKAHADVTETAVATLAHEVRTPLTGILALGELLAASDLPERERRWALAVKSAAEHLAQLTTLMVDGVKAKRGTLSLTSGRFAPRRLADAVAATLSARAEAKGVTADVTISSQLPELAIGDPVRLRAALENLVDNAIRFTESGRVAFAVQAQPASRRRMRLIFSLTDSGIGMSRKEIARLFRPFTQASADVAGRFGGAGLGLVFVKRLAKAMGGDITVASTPRRGSTFRLAVLVEPAQYDPATRPRVGTVAPAAGLRILCAEDNPYGRVILNTILTELGHHVDFVGTGEAAVDAVAAGGHDMLLMDVTLPGIDGIEATRRIRALPGALARIPIVGTSGRAGPSDEAAARAAGMDAYLVKPLSPSALAEIIGTLR